MSEPNNPAAGIVRSFFGPFGNRVHLTEDVRVSSSMVRISAHIPGTMPVFPGTFHQADDYWREVTIRDMEAGGFRVKVVSVKNQTVRVDVAGANELQETLQQMFPLELIEDTNRTGVLCKAVRLSARNAVQNHIGHLIIGLRRDLALAGPLESDDRDLRDTLVIQTVNAETAKFLEQFR